MGLEAGMLTTALHHSSPCFKQIDNFFIRAIPSLFYNHVYLFVTLKYRKSIASGIQTQILVVEGEDADHCTTTTAPTDLELETFLLVLVLDLDVTDRK